ncbi:ABC transporter ATP-binding protein [Acuticoccus kandeliae]|uniref:ABC transporter ATP-binding protein n=1 Tax=Acuticoccus kandeliae TaxID=2073160 RepID=UPI000D3E0FF9|nr:oligopeptide/dipeptide ABC transporter ATP-binding protein [Acuticoccus kandeliae]
MAEPLVSIEDLGIHYRRAARLLERERPPVRAVDGVSFSILEGETLGLVGESGCGKSTLGRTLTGVRRPSAGAIRYRTRDGEVVDLAALSTEARARYYREIRMVFQDPQSSLNPRMRVVDVIGEPLRNFGLVPRGKIKARVAELLDLVGLRPEYIDRYPHAFSGGERQRIGIARAIATDPRLLVADEAVSALDVSIRGQIVNLLWSLKERLGLTYLFISHDLALVRSIADRVVVMYVGKLVETGPTEALFARPYHPYTAALLAAVPVPRRGARPPRATVRGEVADPANPPAGCRYHPRCPFATERCRTEIPAMRDIAPGRRVACHHAETIDLTDFGTATASLPDRKNILNLGAQT